MSIETRARGETFQTFRVTGPVTKATRLAYFGRELHIDACSAVLDLAVLGEHAGPASLST
jgi:hypothetical protein